VANKGETLSESELSRLKPIRGEGNKSWRAFCPFHGSDKQRSLRVDRLTGRFQCFACEAWGYMDWAREEFRASKAPNVQTMRKTKPAAEAKLLRPSPDLRISQPSPLSEPLAKQLSTYQAALSGSLGEEYLADRKISLTLAQSFGVGYSAPGSWAHAGESGRPIRDWNFGRLVFPHTAPDGQLVNLYGRAIGDRVPKSLRHDHLPGHKGYFNFPALERAAAVSEDLYVCEGPFDALSIRAAQPDANVIAIFGVQGWRHDWAAGVKRIVFALDADSAGQKAWRSLARQLTLRGKQVLILPPEAFGGAKDANEAWIQGTLDLA
jgi:DNA primase